MVGSPEVNYATICVHPPTPSLTHKHHTCMIKSLTTTPYPAPHLPTHPPDGVWAGCTATKTSRTGRV